MAPDERRRQWAFVAASALAGALAVPLHPVATLVSVAIAGLTSFFGLWLWRWSGLQQLLRSTEPSAGWSTLRVVALVALGLAVGLLLLAVIRIAIEPALPSIGARIATAGALPIWRRILVIYVAAVGEELIFRLVIMSVIAGVVARLIRSPGGAPSPAVLWTSIAVSALAFSAAHLPSWSGVDAPGPFLAMSVVALNAVGAFVLGYVFATRGIVAAMLVHSGADCAIQLIGPLTG